MTSEGPTNDNHMPSGWHTIKSVLLKEIRMAGNFHLCISAADALFHARLLGESIARECAMFENLTRVSKEIYENK